MLPIYVDFDDVLSETGQACVNIIEREFGRKIAFEDLHSFDLKISCRLTDKEYKRLFELLHEPEEILNYNPIDGAIDVLSAWADRGFDIAIVTGRPTTAHDVSIQWLNQHKVPYHSFIMVDKYYREKMDRRLAISMEELAQKRFSLAIEDSSKMAKFVSEEMDVPVALFDRPWNRHFSLNGNVKRFDAWPQIEQDLEGIE
jgi:uncharacterized HAD superfamily protein